MNECKFSIGCYQFHQIIGSGSFSTVWLGTNKNTGLKVAIKVVNKSSLNTIEASNRFAREVSLLKLIDHPFISHLYDIIDTKDCFCLVMEYAEGGNLFNLVNNLGSIDEIRARQIFVMLISALNYLHNKKFIMHRDLKAENILLDRYNNIRLIDFGLSNGFSKIDPELKTACGSPAYAAPEMIQGCPYTKAADVWSAGVVLYAMVAGRLPFDDSNVQTLMQKVVYTEATYPPSMSRSLVDLLKRLLSKNPEKRLTIPQIINHPWFQQCEIVQIMDLDFSGPEFVDKAIINQMKNMGIDINAIPQNLMLGEYNETLSIYRQLRKEKITESVRQIINSLMSGPKVCISPFANFNQIQMQKPQMSDSMMTLALRRSSLQSPSQNSPTRRMSRPVVLQKPKNHISTDQYVYLEKSSNIQNLNTPITS